MATDRRSHPTVRPHALALGVLVQPVTAERLSFLGPSLAADLSSAMVLDTLGCLSTFPVRQRIVFDEQAPAPAAARLPATWKRHTLPVGEPRPARAAMRHLLSLGCEAALLVATDSPVLPLEELYEGLLALAQTPGRRGLMVGEVAGGAIFAVGLASDVEGITEAIDWAAGAPKLVGEAEENGLSVSRMRVSYRVDSVAGVRQLGVDVEGGAFAPNCRKLFERPELRRAIG